MQKQEYQKKEEPSDQMVTLGPNIIKGEHYFEYVSGTEVACNKCPLGYGVGPEYEVKDGHIYSKGKLMI